MALAIVYVWNTSARTCGLAGPVMISGLSQAGRQVTNSVRFTLPQRSAQLSPDGIGPSKDRRIPDHEVAATMLLIAAGVHPNDPSMACPGHHVDPASWRITVASGGSITTPNSSGSSGPALNGAGGLTTCRGNLAGQSPLLLEQG